MNKLGNFATAIEENDSPLIKSLLAKREVDANARLPRRFNPPALVHASRYCRVAIVELLLNAALASTTLTIEDCRLATLRQCMADSDVMRLLVAHRPNLA
jgi:hypothetical protein